MGKPGQLSPTDFIPSGGVCSECGSHVSHYGCNSRIIVIRPEAEGEDWWASCDNVKCENHYGEGFFQDVPEWEVGAG